MTKKKKASSKPNKKLTAEELAELTCATIRRVFHSNDDTDAKAQQKPEHSGK